MVEAGVGAELVEGFDGAGFGVGAAVDEAGDAGVDDGAGTHGAGLERDDEGALEEPPVAYGSSGLSNGEDFGVGGGVAVGDAAVVAAADDLIGGVVEDDGAYGDFVDVARGAGLGEGFLHELIGSLRHADFGGLRPVSSILAVDPRV